jgi:hypothetical protein
MGKCRVYVSVLVASSLFALNVTFGWSLPAQAHGLRTEEPRAVEDEASGNGVAAVDLLRDSGAPGRPSSDVWMPEGLRCVEPTGESDPVHPSYIRNDTFLNQWGCKIPLREGKRGKGNFGYQHILEGAEENLAQGKPNNHEVTPFAQSLWAAAIGRPGGSLLINKVGYFVASWEYAIRGGEKRTMCVFYGTDDLKYGGRIYKIRGIVTAYWINGNWPNPSHRCLEDRG